MTRQKQTALLLGAVLTLVSAFALTGCLRFSDDDDEGSGDSLGSTVADFIVVSIDGPQGDGRVDQLNSELITTRSWAPGNNHGITFDVLGSLIQTGDGVDGDPGSIVIFSHARLRLDDSPFEPSRDRRIGGPGTDLTGLIDPRGVQLAHESGLLLVADPVASMVSVFGSACSGDVAPLFATAFLSSAYDLAYDEAEDRLFVSLGDGTIAVFDAYIEQSGSQPPNRTIVPADDQATKISHSLRGIAYDSIHDRLLVSDVGASSTGLDGRVYGFLQASVIDGSQEPVRTLSGSVTQLGEPVDVVFDGGEGVLVADRELGRILFFEDFFSIGPLPQSKPERILRSDPPGSLARGFFGPLPGPQVSDLDESGLLIESIVAASSPTSDEDPHHGQVAVLDRTLTAELSQFLAQHSLQDLTLSLTGDAVVTFDDDETGEAGILILGRITNSREDEVFTEQRDRRITGSDTGLTDPRGVDLTDDGLILVVDSNPEDPGIAAFGMDASGNVAPLFQATELGEHSGLPWDLDYDDVHDRLFVTFTDGTVSVFDDFVGQGGSQPPDRSITPFQVTGAARASVDLRGVVHVMSTDQLILSDRGVDETAGDGQLFVIDGASTASGDVAVRTQIIGPDTQLGEPLDLSFDGRNLYVADFEGGMVHRYDALLDQSGPLNLAPTASIEVSSARSIAVVPTYLASRTD